MKPSYPNKPISSINSLAKALNTTVKELEYLSENADKYFFLTKEIQKSDGSVRYTYDVSQRLKIIHDKITKNILTKVIYPNYLQGSLSEKDHISNAEIHTNKKTILKEDITNFFPSIDISIVYQIWVGLFKFSHEVSDVLSKLVTLDKKVVQGCKTSSYLANLVLWSRESVFVEALNSQGYTYTRYVDDIHVSSEHIISREEKTRIISGVYNLFSSINVKPNRKKQEIMPKSQQQTVHKLNVNNIKPSLPKDKRNDIRQLVFLCKKAFEDKSTTISEYTIRYNSTMGSVNYLKRLHHKDGEQLLLKLKEIPPRLLHKK